MAHQGSGVAGLTSKHLHTSRARSHSGLAAGGAGPPAGYVAWWDAAAITGVADGAALNAWPDASGNGHGLVNSGAAPVFYKTTSAKLVNGKPAVWFTAASSQQMVTSAALTQAQPVTIAAVAKATTLGTSKYLCVANSSNNGDILAASNNTWTLYSGSSAAGLLSVDTNLHAVMAVFNSGSSSFSLDGTTSGGLNPGSVGLTSVFNLGSGGGVGFWDGPICEMLIYPSAANAAALAALRAYFTAKWGTP